VADLHIEKVVVTGGRKFTDSARIEADLRALLPLGLRRLAHGGARGADLLADNAARRVISRAKEPGHIEVYPALFRELGRGAGRLRNVEMLESERPDIVLAYPDPESRGTWHCVAEAWRRRIPVLVWVSWLTGGEATRFVQRKVDERGVSLVRHRQGLLEDLALFDRDGRRVIITGSEQFVDQLPEELDG